MKKVSDILGIGLLLVSTGYLLNLLKILLGLSLWIIPIGWVVILVSQVYYLINSWRRR